MVNYLYIALFAFCFAELSTIPQRILITTGLKHLYPFSCVKCLSFWMALIYSYNEPFCIIIAGVTSLLAITIHVLFNRLRWED
jgi:hypothetical protein